MKIAYVVSHPTQFEVPFYRRFEQLYPETLDVYYYHLEDVSGNLDPELGIQVKWGIDLWDGYTSFVLSQTRFYEWQVAFEKHDYDLVIISGYNHLLLVRLMLFCKRRNMKTALKLDTVMFKPETGAKHLYRLVLMKLCRHYFRHYFATGSLCKSYLQQYQIDDSLISYASYIIDNEYFECNSRLSETEISLARENLGVHRDDKIILSLSKLVDRESPWDLLKALRRIEYKDVHVLVAGDGSEREALEAFATKCQLPVTFLGYWPYDSLPKLYAIADLFVHSAGDEPWGVSVQEAMACGLPVIASDRVGSGFDLIAPGSNGYQYPYGDHVSLSKSIDATWQLDALETRKANKRVLSSWNYDVMARNIVNVVPQGQ